MTLPETRLSISARNHLALETGMDPEKLRFFGTMEGPGYFLVLFNIIDPGGPLHGTTRSVRVDI